LIGCVQSLSFSEGLQIENLQGGYKEVAGSLGWIGLRIPAPWEGSSSSNGSAGANGTTTGGGTSAARRRRMMQEDEMAWSAVAAADWGTEMGSRPQHKVPRRFIFMFISF
jgi:hypothetical protein